MATTRWTELAWDANYGQRPLALYHCQIHDSSSLADGTWDWYDYTSGSSSTRVKITALAQLPTRTGQRFLGYYRTSNYYTGRWTSEAGLVQVCYADGTFVSHGPLCTIGDENTMYSQWTRASYNMNFSRGVGTGGVSVLYNKTDGGGWYTNIDATVAATQPVALPTAPAGMRFLGYYSAASGGTQYIDADGYFTAAFANLQLAADATCYAHYETVSYQLTLNHGSGATGGTAALFYRVNGGGIYQDQLCTTEATVVSLPTLAGSRLLGYFSAASGGTKYIDESGTILAALSGATFSAAATIYAQWSQVHVVTLDKHDGSGGTPGIWHDVATDKLYSDATCQTEITSVVPPTKAGNVFLGYYSAASGGTKYINADGSFTTDFPTITGNLVFHAQWEFVALVLHLDAAGGTGAPEHVYYKPEIGFYVDEVLRTPVTAITVPTRPGYTFGGYNTSGSVAVIDASGNILLQSLTEDMEATAAWTAQSFTLSFNYNGGTPPTPPVSSKSVTMGQAVGVLPTATMQGYTVEGWYVGSVKLTETYVWDIPANSTAVAVWKPQQNEHFGEFVDYFGLASSSLRVVSSDSGDNRQRVCVANASWTNDQQTGGAGKYETNVNETSGVWRNPVVTYQVTGDMTLNVVLGHAYAAGGATLSGYMITGVKITTAVGKWPMVTVTGTANEGADAINTFALVVPLIARCRAQNLLHAIHGGGQLQSCDLQASCTPVVVAENNMPCASDVVAGRMTIDATTYAPNGENAPMGLNGFTEVGAPKQCGSTNYMAWKFKAVKEMS